MEATAAPDAMHDGVNLACDMHDGVNGPPAICVALLNASTNLCLARKCLTSMPARHKEDPEHQQGATTGITLTCTSMYC